MNLSPIADLLNDASLGVSGKSIFINMIPSECPNGILLRNKLQGTKIDYELPGYFKTSFQLIVRAQSYSDGEKMMLDAFAALTLSEVQVGSMYVRYVRPITQPVVFPLSKGNLLEFAADFDAVYNE